MSSVFAGHVPTWQFLPTDVVMWAFILPTLYQIASWHRDMVLIKALYWHVSIFVCIFILIRLKDISSVNTRLLQQLQKAGAHGIFEAYQWVQTQREQNMFKSDVYGPVLLEVPNFQSSSMYVHWECWDGETFENTSLTLVIAKHLFFVYCRKLEGSNPGQSECSLYWKSCPRSYLEGEFSFTQLFSLYF